MILVDGARKSMEKTSPWIFSCFFVVFHIKNVIDRLKKKRFRLSVNDSGIRILHTIRTKNVQNLEAQGKMMYNKANIMNGRRSLT